MELIHNQNEIYKFLTKVAFDFSYTDKPVALAFPIIFEFKKCPFL